MLTSVASDDQCNALTHRKWVVTSVSGHSSSFLAKWLMVLARRDMPSKALVPLPGQKTWLKRGYYSSTQ